MRVLSRFAVRVGLLITFSAFGSVGFVRSLMALLWMSIILCAVVAVLKREPLFSTSLNHWDESAAFGAMFALVHVVNEIA